MKLRKMDKGAKIRWPWKERVKWGEGRVLSEKIQMADYTVRILEF